MIYQKWHHLYYFDYGRNRNVHPRYTMTHLFPSGWRNLHHKVVGVKRFLDCAMMRLYWKIDKNFTKMISLFVATICSTEIFAKKSLLSVDEKMLR